MHIGIKLAILLKQNCLYNFHFNPQESPKYPLLFLQNIFVFLYCQQTNKETSLSSREVNASFYFEHILCKFVQSQVTIQRRHTVGS